MFECADAFEECAAILVSCGGFFLCHFLEDMDGAGGDVGGVFAWVGEWFLDMFEHDIGDIGAAKGCCTRKDLKKDDAKSVDIGTMIEGFA